MLNSTITYNVKKKKKKSLIFVKRVKMGNKKTGKAVPAFS